MTVFVYVVLHCTFLSFVPLEFALSGSELRASARVYNMYWSSPKWERIGSGALRNGTEKEIFLAGIGLRLFIPFSQPLNCLMIDKAKEAYVTLRIASCQTVLESNHGRSMWHLLLARSLRLFPLPHCLFFTVIINTKDTDDSLLSSSLPTS